MILFKNNHNIHPRLDLCAMLSIHRLYRFVLTRILNYEAEQWGDQITKGCSKGNEEGYGIVITMNPQGQKKEKRTKDKHPHNFGYFR